MKVKSINEAWEKADLLFPTDYEKDEKASTRAGYPIYRSTASDNYNYICDLGDSLEVNLQDGSTFNIWIEEEEPEPIKKSIEKMAKCDSNFFDPQEALVVTAYIGGYQFETKESQAIYKALLEKRIPCIEFDIIETYCKEKGIPWAAIQVRSITHYKGGEENTGHFIIEAIVKLSQSDRPADSPADRR